MTTKDLPDYTREMVIRHTGGYIGLEELAARLGSCVPGNMPGNLVFMDRFDTELTDWKDESIGGGAVARSSRHKFSGAWSVKLEAELNGGSAYGVISRDFPYPGAKKCGIFMRLGWDDDLHLFVGMSIIYTGSRKLTIGLVYNYLTGLLRVHTTASSFYTVASDLYLGTADIVFYPILITFDLESEEYLNLYFAHQEYSLAGVSVRGLNSSANPQGDITIWPQGSTAPADFDVYLDAVVLTSDVE